jgi:uncharacterized membrane protein YgcG
MFASFLVWMTGIFIALGFRGRIDYGRREARGVAICIGIVVAVALLVLLANLTMWPAPLAFTAAALLVANNLTNIARSKGGPQAIAFRKRLATARQYFLDELRKSAPAIDDRWFPYIVAFGLNDEASKWMKDFGGERPPGIDGDRGSIFSSGSSTSSPSPSRPQWTGGGGAFGGGGASASWGAAAAGLAAGVSAPSSSGGRSGGGGGGRSGGGGGGGW